MNVQEEMLSKVGEQSQIVQIGLYLSKLCSHKYDLTELLQVAKYLLYEQNYSMKDILNGAVDETIIQNLRLFIMHRKSVRTRKAEEKPLLLAAKKKHISTPVAKKLLLGVMGVSIIASTVFAGLVLKDNKQAKEISQYIGVVANGDSSFTGNIVKSQTYHIPNTTDTLAYDNDGLADDIINVCKDKPELFATCILNTYDNMQFNRLSNMDAVIARLRRICSQDISLLWMYSELKNCRVFLDFVMANVDIDMNSDEAKILKQDIDKYAQIYVNNKFGVYESLDLDAQKRIQGLVAKYITTRSKNYQESYANLKVLADNFGRKAA